MERLKKQIAAGESEAFVELYDLLGERLLRYLTARLNANDAHDVLQEVFVRLVRYRRKLAKSDNLNAYVFLVARNEANRWMAKNGRRTSGQNVQLETDVVAGKASIGARCEQQETVAHLLAHLTSEVQEIVQLKIHSGLTFVEVAQIVGMPESTVATKYRRGILKMQSVASDVTEADQNKSQTTPDFVVRRGD